MELSQISHLWLFFALVLGIVIMPGMDMAYVLAGSLVGGKRNGMVAVAGIVTGGLAHVLIGVLGFGIVLKTFPHAFQSSSKAAAPKQQDTRTSPPCPPPTT